MLSTAPCSPPAKMSQNWVKKPHFGGSEAWGPIHVDVAQILPGDSSLPTPLPGPGEPPARGPWGQRGPGKGGEKKNHQHHSPKKAPSPPKASPESEMSPLRRYSRVAAGQGLARVVGFGFPALPSSKTWLQNHLAEGRKGLLGHRDDPWCCRCPFIPHIPQYFHISHMGLPHTGSSWGWGAQAKGPSSAPFFWGPATSSLLRGGPQPSPGAAPGTRALQDALGVVMGSQRCPKVMGSPRGGTSTPWAPWGF